MKILLITIFTISILIVGCGYKTDPIYVENNIIKGIK